jgi:hypothetical protein
LCALFVVVAVIGWAGQAEAERGDDEGHAEDREARREDRGWWNDFIYTAEEAGSEGEPDEAARRAGGDDEDTPAEIPWWNRFMSPEEQTLGPEPSLGEGKESASERSGPQRSDRYSGEGVPDVGRKLIDEPDTGAEGPICRVGPPPASGLVFQRVAVVSGGARGVSIPPVSPFYHRLVVGGTLQNREAKLARLRLGLPAGMLGDQITWWGVARRLRRRVRASIAWTVQEEEAGNDSLKYDTPYEEIIGRFEYEFLLNLVQTAKQFYNSFEDERDKSYGTIGQFTAIYRRVLVSLPRNEWEERMSASAFAYKLGTDTPTFKHMRTGGWAFLEYNMHSYRDPTHRFLLMFAPVGILKDKMAYRESGVSGTKWSLEAATGVEGVWDLGMVSPVVRAHWIPRYAKTFCFRVQTELSLRIRVLVDDDRAGFWFSEVTLVPKFLYMYNSHPLVHELSSPREILSWRMPGWLDWFDFRRDLSAYLQVEFRLKR